MKVWLRWMRSRFWGRKVMLHGRVVVVHGGGRVLAALVVVDRRAHISANAWSCVNNSWHASANMPLGDAAKLEKWDSISDKCLKSSDKHLARWISLADLHGALVGWRWLRGRLQEGYCRKGRGGGFLLGVDRHWGGMSMSRGTCRLPWDCFVTIPFRCNCMTAQENNDNCLPSSCCL